MDYENGIVVAGLRSFQCSIIRRVWQSPEMNYAKPQIFVVRQMLRCFNTIGKRIGFRHMLDAVPVHWILCEYMKCILAMFKVWFLNMV